MPYPSSASSQSQPVEGRPAASVSARFPRLALLVPPLVPFAAASSILVLGLNPRWGGMHSTSGAVLAVILWFGALAATVVELVVVPIAFKRILSTPSLRTGTNVLCLLVPLLFLALMAVWVLVLALKQ